MGAIVRRSYAGLADEDGYVQLGGMRIHVEALRNLPIETTARVTGLSADELRAWAAGPALPLGLWR